MTSLIRYLPFAGTLPFIGCALLLWLDVSSLSVLDFIEIKVSDVLSGYTLVIASFMAGSTWGSHLRVADSRHETSTKPSFKPSSLSVTVPILTNVVALALWVGFLTLPLPAFWLVSIFAFSAILMLDNMLLEHHLITASYYKVRAQVSAVVVLALLVAVVVVL